MSEENTQATEATQESEANLTIQDLTTVMQLIQVAGARGAIRAEEMEVVGALYQKLYAFLDAAGAIQKPEAAEQTSDANAEGSADTTEAK